MQYIEDMTIGTDPELFIVNTKTNKIVSSIGLIPGEKGNAYQPEGFSEGFGLQIDNILAEFNIPPVNNKKDFTEDILLMKEYIRKFVKNINPDLDILCQASALVDIDQLRSKEAMLFGCCPDYNAYTLSQNIAPKGKSTNIRSTGCHVHLGYTNPTIETSIIMIKYLDLYLGVPSVLIDPDNERKKLYGKAGCFRLTSYGFEYRVLSGYFINNTNLTDWVYEQVIHAISGYNNDVKSNFNFYSMIMADSTEIVSAINNNDKILAKKIVDNYSINLPNII